MAESATKKKTSSSSTDWSLLPEELLNIISENLDDCFDIVHARSVCNSWRSTFPFPPCLLRATCSLPSFAKFPGKSKDLCTLEKFPLFLFIVQTPSASASEYFLGGIWSDESEDRMELPSNIQCSVKVKIPGYEPALVNMLNCQILPLGHQYRMIGYDPKEWRTTKYRGVAFLQLSKQEGGGFIVVLNYTKFVLLLRSTEMKWKRVMELSNASCEDVVTFRGRFYATVVNMDVFVIDPFSLKVTLMTPLQAQRSLKYVVACGDDELFMIEKIIPRTGVFDFSRFVCRVGKLDEEAGKWVEVSDLGDRVLFIGRFGNVSCSAKELPDGCGVSGNSIIFTNELGHGTYAYKYGLHTGTAEDHLNFWKFSRENRVTIRSTSPVMALRVER